MFKRKAGILLSGTMLGASFLLAAPALADDAQTEQLQKQINALQKQLQTLQSQVTETKREAKAAQQRAESAPPPSAPSGLYNAAPPPGPSPMIGKAPSWVSGIKFRSPGASSKARPCFASATKSPRAPAIQASARSRSRIRRSIIENEWRGSAQQSRIAIKMSGDIDPTQHLKAYYESDFLGAGVTANLRESDSMNLRVRQAFVEYDNDNYHFHTVAGQAWSLLTQNKVGMLPQTENTPLTIDAQYVGGLQLGAAGTTALRRRLG